MRHPPTTVDLGNSSRSGVFQTSASCLIRHDVQDSQTMTAPPERGLLDWNYEFFALLNR